MASELISVPEEGSEPKVRPEQPDPPKEDGSTKEAGPSKTSSPERKPSVAPITPPSAEMVAASAASQPLSPLPEVFIAILGQTGTGKSSFINAVTGGELGVGHSLASCTQTIQYASTVIKGQKVTLIDTPGFDESAKDDGEILSQISIWLRRAHSQDRLLNGVIYLHRIADTRMQGGSMRSLTILKKLCGTKTYENIILATTMWDMVTEEVGQERERELRKKWWEVIIAGGGKVYRHDEKEKSAKKIVTDMLPNRSMVLDLQDQLNRYEGVVSKTDVGGYVKEYLEKIKEMHSDEVIELRSRIVRLQVEQQESERENNLLKVELKKTTEELTLASSTIEKLAADIQRLDMKIDELEPTPSNVDAGARQQPFFAKVFNILAGWDAQR